MTSPFVQGPMSQQGNSLKTFAKAVLPSRAWSALQFSKAKVSEWTFRHQVVRHDYGGHSLLVHLKDPMSKQWYDCDWKRLDEISLLLTSRLKPGATVFDVGAHQSVVAMMLAREVGEAGRVVALEPNPFNVRMAELNIESNGIKNIIELQAMVSASNGSGVMSFELNSRPVSSEPGSSGRKVSSITIDELARRYGVPDVVFVDIEGFEFEALKAADEVMAHPADWCIELHGDAVLAAFGASNAKVIDRFLDEGFEVYLKPDESAPFSRIENASIAPPIRCHMVALHT
jgi:FkbM family methyltransferase